MTAPAEARYLVGVDVGGTFTDFVAYDMERQRRTCFKVPTDPRNPSRSVILGLQRLLADGGRVRELIHGTTVITNAIVEQRPSATALVTTRGFRDVVEIGRQSRRHLYDLREHGGQSPLVPRDLRLEVTERVAHTGEVLTPLAQEELPGLAARLRAAGVEAVAVCLLHAYANPSHERALKAFLGAHVPYVCISSEVNAEFREFERTNTTILNAYVMPIARRYLTSLRAEAGAIGCTAEIHVIQSNGGMAPADVVAEKPLAMVMSGPAAGVAAAQGLLRELGIDDAVTLDMGGTTTDVCLIRGGQAEVSAAREIEGQAVRLPAVAVETIGAGGGSVAWIDPVGALKVGPRSAAAEPGPACYGRGGEEPTVTDANLVLGYLSPRAALGGGGIPLERALAERALKPLADRLGLSLLEVAHGIVEVANAKMVRAVRQVSVQRGHDLRRCTLVAYGGAGPIHAGRLIRLLQMPRALIPADSSTFSAVGCLVSDVRFDLVQTFRAELAAADLDEVARQFRFLAAPARERLAAAGYAPDEMITRRSLDLRYRGQNYEIEVPLPDGDAPLSRGEIRRRFDERHRARYAFSTEEPVECVNLRVSVIAPRALRHSRPPRAAAPPRPLSWHTAYLTDGPAQMPVYSRDHLPAGWSVAGPAMIEDAWSTTVVYPQQELRVDEHGNLWLS